MVALSEEGVITREANDDVDEPRYFEDDFDGA